MVPQNTIDKILTVALAFGVCFLCGTANARQINLEGSAMSLKICSISGCEKRLKAKGLCSMHVERLRRIGLIGPPGPFKKNLKCGVNECERPAIGKYCGMHRARFYKTGNIGPIGEKIKSPIERILSRIKKTKSGCWEWLGSLSGRDGRASISVDGKMRMGHRVSFEHFKGPIEKGLLICHKCDNPKCVNPDHLFKGTQKDNVYDAIKKGRFWSCKRAKK